MNNNKYCVGLSGNIASGKSTVAALFKRYGIHIISADTISRSLTSLNAPLSKIIIKHFGAKAQLSDGNIDRRYLRHLISNDINAKQWLESCLHPIIRQEIDKCVKSSVSPYTLIEIPLLTNRNDYPYINRVLILIADINIQIQRIITRDHCTEIEAQAILNSQPSIKQRHQLADDIIYNNGALEDLERQVQKLHQLYLDEAKRQNGQVFNDN